MFNFLKKYIAMDVVKLSSILAAMYMLLFNSILIAHQFNYYYVDGILGILFIIRDSIYAYMIIFVIFMGLSINRILFYIGTILLFITGSIASYYLYTLKILPTQQVIASVFLTDMQEVSEILSIHLIIWVILAISISLYTINHFKFRDNKSFMTKIISITCLCASIILITSYKLYILHSYFPMQYLHNTYLYFLKKFVSDKSIIDISKAYNYEDNSADDIIGVLVIGESARYSNFGINGYHRDTTPNLSKIDNLNSFKAMSYESFTHLSVPYLLSRITSNMKEDIDSENTFLAILSKLGFNTVWISTQSTLKNVRSMVKERIIAYDDVKKTILPGANYKSSALDELMLPYFSEAISTDNKKHFIVMHTTGSHWSYNYRYPENFAKFAPYGQKIQADHTHFTQEEIINSYDNTILYTDFFLSSVIKLLTNKNAIMIYVSDHGESLGEDGAYGHGSHRTEQHEIPFIVWTSDKFNEKFPTFLSNIKSHANKTLNHDYVFHSILDCLNIKSSIIDKNFSVCSK